MNGAMKYMSITRRNAVRGVAFGATTGLLLKQSHASVSEVQPDYRKFIDIAKQQMSRVGSRLWKRDKVGIVDFGLPSNEARMFIVDMVAGNIRAYLCAHGAGSDPQHDGWLKNFSNVNGSKATSRGAYMSLEWYRGKYGPSMRLEGLDQDNYAARERAIVVHEAWYAAQDMVDKWGKLGRSEGCFAVPPGMNKDMLYHLGGGRLIFADRITERQMVPIGSPEFTDYPGWTASKL